MNSTRRCSIDCIQQLLPNLAASGLWGAGIAALAVPATAVAIPAAVGLACVAGYIGISRACKKSEEDERADLAAALAVIRKRSENAEVELADLGYQLRFNMEDIHLRLTDLDNAIAGLSGKIDNLQGHFERHVAQFDCLSLFIQENFDALKPFLTALPKTLEALKRDNAETRSILLEIKDAVTGIATRQADQFTKADAEKFKRELLAGLKAAAPANAPPDAALNRDLVAAVERIARDAERGGMTARGVLSSVSPQNVPIYLAARRAQLDLAQTKLNEQIELEKLQLDRELAAVAFVTGRIDDAMAALGRILSHVPNDIDAINRLGHVHLLQGKLDSAETQYGRVLNLAAGDEAWRAAALGNFGVIAQARGDIGTAEKFLREALEIDRKLGRLDGQADQLGNLGLVALARGDLDAAEDSFKEVLRIEETLGRLHSRANALGNLGQISRIRGDYDTAEKLFNEALEIDRKIGRQEGQAAQLGNLGTIALIRRNLDSAESLFREALDIDRKLGQLMGQATVLGNLGLIARFRGDLDASEKLHSESLNINRQVGRLQGQAEQLGNLGSIAEQRGQINDARELWTQSRDLFRRIGISHKVGRMQSWLDGLPNEQSS